MAFPARQLRAVLLSALVRMLAGALVVGPAEACRQTFFYEPLPSDQQHDLNWRVFLPRALPAPTLRPQGFLVDQSNCNHHPVHVLGSAIYRHMLEDGFVLLGEVHDNPHHHHVRAELINLRLASPAALVFEHIRSDQQGAIDALRVDPSKAISGSELFDAIAWDKSGWPDKTIFQPLFQSALDLRLPILAGHPPRESLRAVARGGRSALTDDERRRLRLDEPLPEKLHAALLDELEASHCGLVSKAAFGNMATAQRYRDAHMAAALIDAAAKHGRAILFTGNGHVRSDRGVPFDLRRLAPEKAVMSVVLVETEAGKNSPDVYVPRDPDGRPAAEFVLFTPRTARKDPCVEMRERFGKAK